MESWLWSFYVIGQISSSMKYRVHMKIKRVNTCKFLKSLNIQWLLAIMFILFPFRTKTRVPHPYISSSEYSYWLLNNAFYWINTQRNEVIMSLIENLYLAYFLALDRIRKKWVFVHLFFSFLISFYLFECQVTTWKSQLH